MWLAEKYISDDYFSFVKECLNNKNVHDFKRNYRYNRIVGMSNRDQFDKWDEFFTNIEIDKIDIYKKNDESVAPEMFYSKKFGHISASTLRYIYTSYDISTLFKDIDTVLEIGVGYGGLCYILSNMIDVKTYKLVDDESVKQFASLYLNSLGQTNYITEHDGSCDLLVSEFCFSEFDDEQMNEFYEKYIENAKNIYLVMNLHDNNRKIYWKELLEKRFSLTEKEEFPKTAWPNYIWYGSKK